MTLFHKRWKCFNFEKRNDEDYLTFASIVNKHCDNFRLAGLSADDFKFLIFTQGLVLAKNSEIRLRVLSKLESEPGLSLQKLAEDCQRVVSFKNDSKNIEESGVAYVRRTSYKTKNYAPWKSSENKKYDQTQAKNRRPIQKPKLPTSMVNLATKQHAVGTKEIKTVRQARLNIKTEKNRRKYETVHILDKKRGPTIRFRFGPINH